MLADDFLRPRIACSDVDREHVRAFAEPGHAKTLDAREAAERGLRP
jgi:hypothetical protein